MNALELADKLYKSAKEQSDERNCAYDVYGWNNTPENTDSLKTSASEMLRYQYVYIQILRENFEHLLEACEDSNGCQYGTLSCTFVEQVANAALKNTDGL